MLLPELAFSAIPPMAELDEAVAGRVKVEGNLEHSRTIPQRGNRVLMPMILITTAIHIDMHHGWFLKTSRTVPVRGTYLPAARETQ